MFLAAAPYFQTRFANSPWLLTHFQSSIISVATITNLISMILLTKLQRNASYPKRIIASLVINIVIFTLLALSTAFFRHVSEGVYFGFLMVIVFTASLAASLTQNGLLAYVSGFGVAEYMQGIMTGQALAGVLPCIAQIVAVLSVPERKGNEGAGQDSPASGFAYFMTATGISSIALLAFFYLIQHHKHDKLAKQSIDGVEEAEEDDQVGRKVVGMRTLFRKLKWLAMAVFLVFSITMVFPVFTQEILSVRPIDSAPRWLKPPSFIPLAFLFWNAGDLVGRLMNLYPQITLFARPRAVFAGSILRTVFIPLYLLCNIKGRGSIIPSDFFYLFIVQFFFGLTNGYLGSTCMIAAASFVEVEEREAAGGFMGLILVWGLTIGSLLSFLAAKA